MRKVLLMLVLAAVIPGCKPWEAWGEKQEPVAMSGFVRDSARVVSIDQGLGQIVLDYRGREVKAFWQTEVTIAQGGIVSREDSSGLRGPVGQYKPPVVKEQKLNVNPGDRIEFVGMWTNDQIFLRSVAVVP